MKIIAGKWKGRRVSVVTSKKTRPTSSLVRKAYFDTVNPWLEGCSFLDLFSGTGLMGIEALSRGAVKVFFCESERILATNITSQVEKLRREEGDDSLFTEVFFYDWRRAVKILKKRKQYFFLIYSDPPYSFSKDVSFVVKLAMESLKLLRAGGIFSIELPSQSPWTTEEFLSQFSQNLPQNKTKYRLMEKKYGSTRLFFFSDKNLKGFDLGVY